MARLFNKSLLLATTSAALLFASHASAADSPYFYPKEKWIIKEVALDGNADTKVCTLSNTLNNGYAVQFAGTKDGLSNINLSMNNGDFVAHDTYEVTYAIPGITTETIASKAFSDNMIVSDLRHKTDFANALTSSTVLDVSRGDDTFRIYLTGLENAMTPFGDCVGAKEVAAPKTATTPAAIPQQSAASIVPPPPLNDDSILKPVTAADTAIAVKPSGQKYTQKMAKRLKAMGSTTATATHDPIPMDAPAAPAETVAPIPPKADEIVLEDVIEGTAAVKAPPVKPQTPADKIAAALEDTAAKVTVSKSEPIIADVTDQVAVKPVHKSTPPVKASRIAAMEKQIDMLQEKNKMLQSELEITVNDAREEQAMIASENWGLEQATMKFQESERQVMRLGRQLQSYKAECEAEKAELENMLFDPQVTEKQQQIRLAELESALSKAEADLYRQQRRYEERIKMLEQRLDGR